MIRPAIRLRSCSRRAVAALALAGFLVATIGLPVVEPRIGPNGKDISRPFPCMYRQCGCRSAAGCWRSCCCHTHAEKLAWAAEHGVTPPEYAVSAAERGAARGCCAAKASSEGTRSCCSKQTTDEEPVAREPGLPIRLGLIPAVAAQKCQGITQVWLMLSAAAPPLPIRIWQPETAVVSLAELPLPKLTSGDFFPPTPPPKA
ncbi:MAG: hypothetical protein SFU86_21725 [Pirellulaceae bacterium]|nr:hypothetical protein [Pirellulaceae bacterium]